MISLLLSIKTVSELLIIKQRPLLSVLRTLNVPAM